MLILVLICAYTLVHTISQQFRVNMAIFVKKNKKHIKGIFTAKTTTEASFRGVMCSIMVPDLYFNCQIILIGSFIILN